MQPVIRNVALAIIIFGVATGLAAQQLRGDGSPIYGVTLPDEYRD